MNTTHHTAPLSLSFYPARPANGGALVTESVRHDWSYEDKYNGWRAIVHVPTSTMFNRKGERLSIEEEFEKALGTLRLTDFTWLDCEALERRHGIGRGSLIVLDGIGHRKINDFAGLPYTTRRQMLGGLVSMGELEEPEQCEPNQVYLANACIGYGESSSGEPATCRYQEMQDANKRVGCQFYEGLVAKKPDSIYPKQFRNPDLTFPFWVKHRWAF